MAIKILSYINYVPEVSINDIAEFAIEAKGAYAQVAFLDENEFDLKGHGTAAVIYEGNGDVNDIVDAYVARMRKQ